MERKIIRVEQKELAAQFAKLQELKNYVDKYKEADSRSFTYYLRTFGCQQNENDSEKIAGLLEAAGFKPAKSYEEAELVLINTCSIRENADERLFGHLGQLKALKKQNKNLIVAVCGCLPTQEVQAERIKRSFSFVNLLFGPHEIWRLPEMLWDYYQGQRRVYRLEAVDSICENLPLKREKQHRALVSIMYGCNNFCSYCVVPFTRGRERSRLAADILQECRDLAAAGSKEVMLLGQNVNAWGRDLIAEARQARGELSCSRQQQERLELAQAGLIIPESFAELLAAIAGIPGLKWIRYMSSHPRDFDGQLITALGKFPQIENHLHLPLQSGSDAVLRAMRRHYDLQRFREIVSAVRDVRPNIALTTDIIVGFPHETESDFQATLEAVAEFEFSSAFTFIYSARPGTEAAKWPQLEAAVQHERFGRLQKLQDSLAAASLEKLCQQECSVIIEGLSSGEPGRLSGRDSQFHLINIDLPPALTLPPLARINNNLNEAFWSGQEALVRIKAARSYSLEADLLSIAEV